MVRTSQALLLAMLAAVACQRVPDSSTRDGGSDRRGGDAGRVDDSAIADRVGSADRGPPTDLPSADAGPGSSSWIRALGGTGHDYAPTFHVLADGYLVAGMSASFAAGGASEAHDFLLVRLDGQGLPLWGKTIGGPGDEQGSFSIKPTREGGFLLTGFTDSFGAGATDALVVKLDSGAEVEWAVAIGGPHIEAGKVTQQADDGGYLMVGETGSFGSGGSDVLLVKLTGDGQLSWAKALGGPLDDSGSSIERTDDGYVIGGKVESFSLGGADALVTSLDRQGNLRWSEAVGGADGDEAVNWDGLRVARDGGYFFGDATSSFGASGRLDFWAVKLRADGSLEWSTQVAGPYEDAGWTMNEVDDGYVAGGKYGSAQRNGDVLLLRLDPAGQVVWGRTFGGDNLDEIEEVKPVGGGYVMTGVTRLGGSREGDILVARLDGNGQAAAGCRLIKDLPAVTVSAAPTKVTPISLAALDIAPRAMRVMPTVTSVQVPARTVCQ